MNIKTELKILGALLVTGCSAFAIAQPVYGSGTGAGSVSARRTTTKSVWSTTNGGGVGTNVSPLEPLDPSRDSRIGNDTVNGSRAKGMVSGTTAPRY